MAPGAAPPAALAAAAFCRALRRCSIARMRLRCVCSISRNIGKVARTLMRSGSPAWMPATMGSAMRSSASRPRRLRTKSPRLSSSPPDLGGAAARQQQVHAHAHLARPADEAAQRERHDARGHHQDDPFGKLVQAAARIDEAAADVLIGVQEAVADAQVARQPDGPGLLDDGRVRAAFHDEAVAAHGVHLAAEARLVLVEVPVDRRIRGARVFEDARRPQARHAAADDGDAQRSPLSGCRVGHRRHPPWSCGPLGGCTPPPSGRRARWSMTTSASASMKSGESLGGVERRYSRPRPSICSRRTMSRS